MPLALAEGRKQELEIATAHLGLEPVAAPGY